MYLPVIAWYPEGLTVAVLPLARKSDTPTNHNQQSVQKNKKNKRESISVDQ